MAKMMTERMERINKRLVSKKGRQRKYSFLKDAWRRLKRNRTAVIGMWIIVVLLLVAIFGGALVPFDPNKPVPADANQTPNSLHWFGTDDFGRDLFSRCIYGARYSLPIGIICMLTSLLVGGMIGLCAAYFGGSADMLLMRIMDIFQSIPGTLLSITVVATLGTGIPQLVIAITISFMPAFSKIVRAAIFTVRQNEYVGAARSLGAGNMRIMLKYLLPNALGHIIIFAVGVIATSISIVSTLSYIGLGLQAPTPEWGALLNAGKTYLQTYPHMVVFPGLMILITLLAFNLFGDGLRDALDPRLK